MLVEPPHGHVALMVSPFLLSMCYRLLHHVHSEASDGGAAGSVEVWHVRSLARRTSLRPRVCSVR